MTKGGRGKEKVRGSKATLTLLLPFFSASHGLLQVPSFRQKVRTAYVPSNVIYIVVQAS